MIPRGIGFALFALVTLGLAGCGRQAQLDRPAPLIGKPHPPSAEILARDQAAARARADNVGAEPRAPLSLEELRDQGAGRASTPPPSAVPPPPEPPAPTPPQQ